MMKRDMIWVEALLDFWYKITRSDFQSMLLEGEELFCVTEYAKKRGFSDRFTTCFLESPTVLFGLWISMNAIYPSEKLVIELVLKVLALILWPHYWAAAAKKNGWFFGIQFCLRRCTCNILLVSGRFPAAWCCESSHLLNQTSQPLFVSWIGFLGGAQLPNLSWVRKWERYQVEWQVFLQWGRHRPNHQQKEKTQQNILQNGLEKVWYVFSSGLSAHVHFCCFLI